MLHCWVGVAWNGLLIVLEYFEVRHPCPSACFALFLLLASSADWPRFSSSINHAMKLMKSKRFLWFFFLGGGVSNLSAYLQQLHLLTPLLHDLFPGSFFRSSLFLPDIAWLWAAKVQFFPPPWLPLHFSCCSFPFPSALCYSPGWRLMATSGCWLWCWWWLQWCPCILMIASAGDVGCRRKWDVVVVAGTGGDEWWPGL